MSSHRAVGPILGNAIFFAAGFLGFTPGSAQLEVMCPTQIETCPVTTWKIIMIISNIIQFIFIKTVPKFHIEALRKAL